MRGSIRGSALADGLVHAGMQPGVAPPPAVSPPQVTAEVLPARSIVREMAVFTRRNPIAVAGGVVGFLIVVMAIVAPLIAPFGPLKTDFRQMTKPPSALHYFDTDQVGRDTLSRAFYGARTSLADAIY